MKFCRVIAVSLAMLMLFAGCSTAANTVAAYDVNADADNLDPQFATDKTARLIIANIFEGLVIRAPDGSIHPGAAESWEIADSGLTLTFKLREGASWYSADKEAAPVTAGDFKFGLQRLFLADSPSPHARQYLAVKNASKVLGGQLDQDSLGIVADDDYTLTITLEQPDDMFLEKLSHPGAMPCNEEFFRSTKGRYGRERGLLATNGPFRMTRWERDNRISLTRSDRYLGAGSTGILTVELFIGREDSTQRFYDGITNILKVPDQRVESIDRSKYLLKGYYGTTWAICFNTDDEIWGMPLMRSALAYATYRDGLVPLEGEYIPADNLFAPELMLAGSSMDQLADNLSLEFNPEKGYRSYLQGVEALGLEEPISVTLYVPEGVHEDYLSGVVEGWQEYLGIQVVPSRVNPTQYEKLISSGDFGVALVPVVGTASTPKGMLEPFVSGALGNCGNYNNKVLDSLIEDIDHQRGSRALAQRGADAQWLLLADGGVIPLYRQRNYYALTKETQQVDIYYNDDIIRFNPVDNMEKS